MSFKLKQISIIIILGGFCLNQTFAQNTGLECLKDREQANIFVELILRLLTWFWIIPATLAGKLMTNSILYGEFINIDKILYVLRNMSRTFANFFAAGMILWKVIQGILDKSDGSAIMKKILRIGAGIILANMSRFLTGAVVDISTILTSTVSALPGTYFSADTASRNMILTQDGKNISQKKIILDLTTKFCDGGKVTESRKKDTIFTGEVAPEDQILDMFMPKNESIAGPLLYIGSSVLKVQDFIVTNNTNSSGVDYFMIIIIRLFMTVIFFMALIMLLVINVIRIVSLWFFISFSPLIILYSIIKENMTLPIDALKDFSITNIIKLIFAPVIITGLLSIALIVIVLMQQILQSNNNYIDFTDGVYISTLPDKDSRIGVNGIFQTDIQGELLSVKENVANTFSDLIMGGLTLAILWGVIMAIKSYLDGTRAGNIVSSMSDLSTHILGSIPMIPISGGGKVSIGALKDKIGSLPDTISKGLGKGGQEKLDDISNALTGTANKYLGTQIALKMPRGDQNAINKVIKDMQSRKVTINDIGSLFEIAKKHNTKGISGAIYPGTNNSLSDMEFGSTISHIFKQIRDKHNNDIRSFVGEGNTKILIRGDMKDIDNSNLEKFIKMNLDKDNGSKTFKNLLGTLFEKLGGDRGYIDSSTDSSEIARRFRSKSFKRTGETTT